jgi:hypothetical protein
VTNKPIPSGKGEDSSFWDKFGEWILIIIFGGWIVLVLAGMAIYHLFKYIFESIGKWFN